MTKPNTAPRKSCVANAPRFAIAPGHAADGNFQFFRLGPDEAWLFYPLEPDFVEKHLMGEPGSMASSSSPPKRWAIAPAGGQFEGWEEMLRRTVGRANLNQGIYWVTDAITAATFLSPRAKGSSSAHDPSDFDQR